MKKLFLITILLLSSKSLFAQSASEILATSPEQAAKKALSLGNNHLFMVPGCFDGVPGYRGGQPKTYPKQLWKSCEELFGKEQYKKVKALEAWAKKYNLYVIGNSK